MQTNQEHIQQSFADRHPSKRPSDLSRAFSEDGKVKTHIGGQALLGGVMMRGYSNWAAAVRTPKGTIYTEEHDLSNGGKTNWRKVPIVRGCISFFDSLIIGYKALEVSIMHSDVAYEEVEDADDSDDFGKASESSDTPAVTSTAAEDSACKTDETSNDADEEFGKKDMIFSMVIGLALGLLLFIVAPAALANLLVGEYDHATLAWNLVDGFVRVAVFVGYIWGIGRMPDMKEMFEYHGAEHKTIHCYEHGLPLTPENARQFPRLHVRCGTAFLIMVMIIAILVYTLTPVNWLISALGVPSGLPKLSLVILTRIVLLPLIAGISYEITVKWAGTHPENKLVKVILWPGMQMQYLTTREPNDAQLECAIEAMKCVLRREARDGDVQASAYAEKPLVSIEPTPRVAASVATSTSDVSPA